MSSLAPNNGFGEPNVGVGERRSIGGNLGVMGAGVVGAIVSDEAGGAFLFLGVVWCIPSAIFLFFDLSAVAADALDEFVAII